MRVELVPFCPCVTCLGCLSILPVLSGMKHSAIFAARAIRPESFGLFAAHAAQAPSCQAAILRACRTVRFHQNGSVMRLYSDGLSTTWSYKLGLPLTTGRHHHAVHSLLTLFASMVSYIGHVPKLIEVGLEAPAYGTAEVLEKLFNAPIRWSCNSNYLRFPSELLLVSRSPSAPVHSPVTFSDLMRYARSAPPDSCAEKTTAAIRICMAKGEISLEAVARYLNKGPRTVQRQLAREGFTFNEILEGLRLERAEELIIETQLPLKQISSLLCYSDPAHFTRAYHRWKGLSPSERRQVILM